MNDLELRQQLQNIIRNIVWWWHMLPSQQKRDHYKAMQKEMSVLLSETQCPFTYKELEAYKYGNVSVDGSGVQRPSITVQKAQSIDEWFDGYEVQQ